MIICFDLDGTLVNSNDWVIPAQIESFKSNGIKITKKQIYDMWGLTLHDQIKKIDPEKSKETADKVAKDFEKIRKATISKAKPFKNTKRILRLLSKKYTLVILSNNPHKVTQEVLKKAKIDESLFSLIVGKDEVKHPKPFPDEIYKAERKFRKKIKFMVGDSPQDIKTAKAANVKSIIILNAPKQTWKNLKSADFIIKDIKEIPKIIKEVDKCHNT